VDVKDRLPRRFAVIDDQPIAIRIHLQVPRDLRRTHHRHPDDVRLVLVEVVERRNVRARNDQHVRRRLRIDVVEGDGDVVFEHFLRRDFAADDAAEEATVVGGHGADDTTIRYD